MPYKDPTSEAARASARERERRYREKNREQRLEQNRRWREENHAYILEKEKERRTADPEKWQRRVRIKAAARVAHPERQLCEVGDCSELGERHHDDYSKPTEIRWLCRRHHMALHQKEG